MESQEQSQKPEYAFTIRIHPPQPCNEDVEGDFLNFCLANNIDDYILTFEDDAARPHYHTYVVSEKTEFKLKQSFRKIFPYLKGNKHHAFTPVNDAHGCKKYICKGGDFRYCSPKYTPHDLEEYRNEWLKTKGELAQKKENKKQKQKKTLKDLEEVFKLLLKDKPSIVNVDKNQQFIEILKEFILANNIKNYNKNFIEKYYRTYLCEKYPVEYEFYIWKTITHYLEGIII